MDENNWQSQYGGYAPGEPVDQQSCIHKFVSAPNGQAYCEKCGAVLRGGAGGRGRSTGGAEARRGSIPWGWLVLAAVVVLAGAAVFGWKYATKRPAPIVSAAKPQVIDIAEEPVQIDVAKGTVLYKRSDGMTFPAFASYKINAKVIGVRAWAAHDKASTGFPIDLALTWGDVAKSDYHKYVDFHFTSDYLANQWLMFQFRGGVEPPWTQDYFLSHVSNNHVCPASQNLYNAVMSLKEGDEVVIEGYLSGSTGVDGKLKMNSSLTRGDTGAGACEAFFVQKLQVGSRVYE
jgi:hypothetical protein